MVEWISKKLGFLLKVTGYYTVLAKESTRGDINLRTMVTGAAWNSDLKSTIKNINIFNMEY